MTIPGALLFFVCLCRVEDEVEWTDGETRVGRMDTRDGLLDDIAMASKIAFFKQSKTF